VRSLLGHLEEIGFSGAPRPVEDHKLGADLDAVTFIEGESAHPFAWSDAGIVALGQLLRSLHEATSTFRSPGDAVWQDWYTRATGPGSVIGHGDPAPWNVVAREGVPIALVDWECAGPVNRLDEIAHAAWLNCQLHDDDVAAMNNLPNARDRARQLRLFVDAYGLGSERDLIVERMIETAVRACAYEAIEADVTPDSTDPAPLWGLAWRARSAAWMLRHRELLLGALTD
jgi:Ser/Thr protein kinase RdoA (MazF antagonist)